MALSSTKQHDCRGTENHDQPRRDPSRPQKSRASGAGGVDPVGFRDDAEDGDRQHLVHLGRRRDRRLDGRAVAIMPRPTVAESPAANAASASRNGCWGRGRGHGGQFQFNLRLSLPHAPRFALAPAPAPRWRGSNGRPHLSVFRVTPVPRTPHVDRRPAPPGRSRDREGISGESPRGDARHHSGEPRPIAPRDAAASGPPTADRAPPEDW